MIKQRVEEFQLESIHSNGRDSTQQINDIIDQLINDGKKVVGINPGMHKSILVLYEYED